MPIERAKAVVWLEVVMEVTVDESSRLSAMKTLVSVDKLNMTFAKLELTEHVASEQRAEPDPPAMTAAQVDTDAQEKPKSVFERLRALEKFYASRDNPSEGPAPGRGS